MIQKFKLIFLLLSLTFVPIIYAQEQSIDYIIDTDIGGDIDDVLTLLVALNDRNKPIAITTTHIEPMEKARIAKLIVTLAGHPEIPVYAGIGTTREDSKALFLEQNPLWPPVFGYPKPSPDEKTWYVHQALPYKQSYGSFFEEMIVENEFAPEYIARLAKNYSPQHQLLIVAIGPLHNIAEALKIAPEINQNIKIYAMGGVYPKGYNWLVSPAQSAAVLSQVETISVLSSLIEKYQFYITPEEFKALEQNTHSKLGHAIIKDWKNWYKMDENTIPKTHLSDLITLYLALHPNEINNAKAQEINFPCLDDKGLLKPEFYGLWYNMPGLEDQLMTVTESEISQSKFVYGVTSAENIKSQLITSIEKILK